MNKQILIDLISHDAKVPKAAAERMLDVFIGGVIHETSHGLDVVIRGFGTFSRAYRQPRVGVNPQSGEKIQIAGTFYPKFKAGREMKEAVKNGKV